MASFRDQFNTELTPAEKVAFQAWTAAESARRTRDVTRDLEDYDLQGYWKDIGQKETAASQGHMTDTYKKPNHPTFSDESRYHGASAPWGRYEGGRWTDTTYTPSASMLAHTHKLDDMRKYFADAEPGVKLVEPTTGHLTDEEAKNLGLPTDEVDPVALGLEPAPKPAPTEPPGFFETFGNRLLNGYAPGNKTADRLAAEMQAARKAGIADPRDATAAQTVTSDALKPLEQAAIQARSTEQGKAHPWGAALGTNIGQAAAVLTNPLARIPIAGMLKSAPAAAEAMGGGIMSRLFAKGAAGASAGLIAQAAAGHEPTGEGMAVGSLGALAPVLTGLGIAGSALQPGMSAEERATRALAGGPMAALGAMSNIAEAAPWFRKSADTAAARAIGMKMKDVRRAGGVEGAQEVGNRLLREKLIPLFGDVEGNTERVMGRRNEVGQQIAESVDKIGSAMTPEQQGQMRPFVVAAKVQKDLLHPEAVQNGRAVSVPGGLEDTAARRPLIPTAQGIAEDISAVGGEAQKPMSFSELRRQTAAYGDEAYKAANPFAPSPKASVLQDTYRSLNEHAERLGGETAQQAGPEAYAKWLEDKARYGDLEKAAQSGAEASNRMLSNRGISLSDYQVGTGGGVSPKTLALGAVNKVLRERGNSASAVIQDAIARFGEKLPLVWGERPAGPTPVPPSSPAPMPDLPPGSFHPEFGAVSKLSPPQHIPGNGPFNKASALEHELLLKKLFSGEPMGGSAIVDPTTGEMIRDAAKLGTPDGPIPGDWSLSRGELPPAVQPATSGALEPLTPRLRATLGAPENEARGTVSLRPASQGPNGTKKSPKRR